MKTDRKTTIIAASTLAAGLLFGWLIFGGADSSSAEEHGHDTAVESETTWTCSMHPQIRQEEPGDCPLCGMDLIPLDEDEGDGEPLAIRMSPTAMQLAGVSTLKVTSAEAMKSIRLTGKVQADERLVHSQSSHIPGRIEQLRVAYTGAYVRKGDAIASIYSPELTTAQEELFEAQKTKATVPRMFNAAKEKLKNWKLTEAQIDQLLEEGTARETFDIHADVSGYVVEKKVNRGDYVRTGEALYEIADLSRVWVLFDLFESDVSWVKKGATVDFTVGSLPGESFEGTVAWVDPVIDPRTRVARARVEFDNSSLKLKPEMFVTGTVAATLPDRSESIAVPKSAVMWTGKRSLVYVRSDTDQGVSFVMREVTLGPALGDSYIIESGLQEGEEIAVSGTFSIDAAAQLAGKPSMMSPEGGPVMTGHDHGGHGPSGQQAAEIDGRKERFEVKGLCGMCKSRIEETAMSVEGVGMAVWDQETTILEVVFDEELTSVDTIQRAIAAVGHDTPLHKADDEVYENLPGCCKYDRSDSEKEMTGHEGHNH
jgi:membrane fusion protein, copper/silver efflux system